MRRMSSISCSGSSTSLMRSSCKGGSSPPIIRPRCVTLIKTNQFIPESLSRGYGMKLTWSACEANTKDSNWLYLRPTLKSTTPNLLNRTPLLTTGRTSHICRWRISASITLGIQLQWSPARSRKILFRLSHILHNYLSPAAYHTHMY